MKNFFLLSVLSNLFSTICFSQSWVQLSDFPSTERDDAVSFVIYDKAYCGTGFKTGWVNVCDFYCFDFVTEHWTEIASMPNGNERQYACGFSYNGYGYVFGGTNGNSLNDLWRYNPSENSWSSMQSKPGLGLAGACCFVINNKVYIVGGMNSSTTASNQVWEYQFDTNVWVQKNNLPFGGCRRASSVEYGGKGYLIFGKDSIGKYLKKLYEYNPVNDTWSTMSDFPQNGRTYSSMQTCESNLVVLGGIDSLTNYYNDLWYYTFSDSLWHFQTNMPSVERKGGISFATYNTFYYSCGIDSLNNRLKETWKLVNPTSLRESINKESITIYPNPVSKDFYLDSKGQKINKVELYDMNGINIKTFFYNTLQPYEIAHTAEGFYLLKIYTQKKIVFKRLVVSGY